ncbi:MAG: hypothetical protein HEQ23_09500 [Tepidisphaera sp.]
MNVCIRVVIAALLSVPAVLGMGCETSRWETGLARGPDAASPLPQGSSVRVREVPWERVEATLASLRADVAASSVHPDEWPAEKREEHKIRLLNGLQISESPTSVKVLGKTEFRAADKVVIPSEELTKLALGLGADTVVWSSRPLGKADRIVQEPVTWYNDGTTHWRDKDGGAFGEMRTGWVPVRVQVDETGYVGFFLRSKP